MRVLVRFVYRVVISSIWSVRWGENLRDILLPLSACILALCRKRGFQGEPKLYQIFRETYKLVII